MQFRHLLAIASLGVLGTIGCDAGSFVTATADEVPVRISVDVADLAVSGVAVEVTGPGIVNEIVANLPISEGLASGSISVLAGSNRAFTLRAFDAQGLETHRGGDTLNIAADQTTILEATLTPLLGAVDIEGRVGEYTVEVTPSTGSIAVGQALQLEVTVLDAHGAVVPDAGVVWGSSNPAVASVTSGGLVEGLVSGTATIGASFQGFSGTTSIAVD